MKISEDFFYSPAYVVTKKPLILRSNEDVTGVLMSHPPPHLTHTPIMVVGIPRNKKPSSRLFRSAVNNSFQQFRGNTDTSCIVQT